jgi:hypothetical protein
MNTFFSWKNVTLPHLAVLHENLKASWRRLLFEYFDRAYFQEKSSLVFENFNLRCASRQICFRIFWTWSDWQTCLGWYCNPQLLQPWFSTNFRTSPLLFYYNDIITKNFSAICAKEKFVGNSLHIHLIEIIMQTFRWKSLRGRDSGPQLIVVSGLFWWESLRGWDFRPQLVVVSGLFRWESLRGWDF